MAPGAPICSARLPCAVERGPVPSPGLAVPPGFLADAEETLKNGPLSVAGAL